jgi:hypothetical protein
MYLRLKQDVLRDKHRTRMLRVEVLESYRNDRLNGEPRNRLVFYAGSVPESGLNLPDYQYRFWRDVDIRLTRLRLSAEVEERVKETLLSRIPRPASLEAVIASVIKRSRRVTNST